MWFIAVLMIALLAWVVSQRNSAAAAPGDEGLTASLSQPGQVAVDVPEFSPVSEVSWISAEASPHTVIPDRPRVGITTYEVQAGDSVFGIGKKFNIKPETVLWANTDILQDNPNDLSIGQKLMIPAVDGVIVKWKSSDTIEAVAAKYKSTPEAILTWPDNHIDLTNPKIAAGTYVMVPGGSRELHTWVIPTIWRPNSGATRGIQSQCGAGGTALGTGTFGWPTVAHFISGNDFWSGHLGLDIGAATGAPVYAADTGVVVYAGPISGGYGNMVMIDHGNGFHTVYAHLSQIIVRCGQNVSQGSTIAYSGSTGNSTGPHLHFEIRYLSSFVNPHDYVR
jgi:murein DD-endopeptidase MepM/ murein hydrolase activator NlpD